MLKRLFYISGIILMLTIAYSVGAHSVNAQSGGQFAGIAIWDAGVVVITSTGDLYARCSVPVGKRESAAMIWSKTCDQDPGWTYMGNVLKIPADVKKK